MREHTIQKYLDDLADRMPAPGGGAVAALHLAQAAALVAMVARYSTGARYAEHAADVERILTRAEGLRDQGLELAELDAAAFGEVAQAYGLPKDTLWQRDFRSAAIARAALGAALPPAAVIGAVREVLAIAGDLVAIGNRSVLSDVAAAADAARAAANTARINVEVNLGSVRDEHAKADLQSTVDEVDQLTRTADAVSAAVRKVILP
jgi:formiminotetrahydrofolate cyclodeaminase